MRTFKVVYEISRTSYKILSLVQPAFSRFPDYPRFTCTPAALSFASHSYVPSAYIPQKLFRMQLRRPSSIALIGQHISPKQREFFRIKVPEFYVTQIIKMSEPRCLLRK